MIVVDTNIISYLHLDSPYKPLVDFILQIDRVWVAPKLWRSEFRNVLVTYLRQELLSLDQTISILYSAVELMDRNEYEVSSAHVIELAYESGCSAYDCEFVALAQDLKIRLVTADKKVLRTFPDIAVSPEDFLRHAGMHRQT